VTRWAEAGAAFSALVSGGRAEYKTLFIALGGGQVRVGFPAPLNLICGLLVSDFGAPAAPSTAGMVTVREP
jgi:hypothetical protein